jgi:asparagine synthase (glutamine-hydrolysing)
MVIPKLYLKIENFTTFSSLFRYTIKGEFAFVLFEFDNTNKLVHYIAGRDSVGIRPLYTNKNSFDTIDIFSSEMKGMGLYKDDIMEFPPGIIRKTIIIDNAIEEYNFAKYLYENIYGEEIISLVEDACMIVNSSAINSISRRLTADRPIAFLLSGGVDSSLVCAISMSLLKIPIRTFCCGIKGSTDMIFAKMVATYIGSIHTEIYFTEEEGLAVIDDVIYTSETWDTTTIRASVGQYIAGRYISQHTDCKVVLVGEGPDEVCSSYLFNFYAPNGTELDKASKEYVAKIHVFDGRRADRCLARWGLEARIPLLDPEFIANYWDIDNILRMPTYFGTEKYILRKAFDSIDKVLPDAVLWRKKEAFSDGISSLERSWFTMIQEYIEKKFNSFDYTFNIPLNIKTKESQYYMYKFIEYFGINRVSCIPHYWQPKWDKDGNEVTSYVDPSARTLSVYS